MQVWFQCERNNQGQVIQVMYSLIYRSPGSDPDCDFDQVQYGVLFDSDDGSIYAQKFITIF